MSHSLKSEIERRQNATEQVLAIFRAAPRRWIHWRRFEAVSACSWRTRISEARKHLALEGGVIENNHSITRSAYRYLPHSPLGPSAETEREGQRTLPGLGISSLHR